MARQVGFGVLGVYVLTLVVVTLTPLPKNPFLRNNVVPFRSITAFVTDSIDANLAAKNVVGNLVMLVPLGVLAVLVLQLRPRMALLVVLVASVAIEVAQAVGIDGRVGDVDDVILNTAGGAIGVACGAIALRAWNRSKASLVDRPLTTPS